MRRHAVRSRKLPATNSRASVRSAASFISDRSEELREMGDHSDRQIVVGRRHAHRSCAEGTDDRLCERNILRMRSLVDYYPCRTPKQVRRGRPGPGNLATGHRVGTHETTKPACRRHRRLDPGDVDDQCRRVQLGNRGDHGCRGRSDDHGVWGACQEANEGGNRLESAACGSLVEMGGIGIPARDIPAGPTQARARSTPR